MLSQSTLDSDTSPLTVTARTSHAALLDNWGRMWVVGGETFSKKSRHMVATYQVPKVDLAAGGEAIGGVWQEVHAKSNKGPSARYGHSAVLHEHKVNKSSEFKVTH